MLRSYNPTLNINTNDIGSRNYLPPPSTPYLISDTSSESNATTCSISTEGSRTGSLSGSSVGSVTSSLGSNNETGDGQVPCELRNAYREEIGIISHWRRKGFGLRSHYNFLISLYDSDPLGWFVALNERGEIIGNIYGINLSTEVAFGGLYGVEKPYRCQGIGGMLWNVRMNYIGDRNFAVNAVESRLEANVKLGLKPSFKMETYIGYLDSEKVNNYLTSEDPIDSLNSTTTIPNFRLVKLGPYRDTKDQPENGLLDPEIDYTSVMNALITYDSSICQIPRPLFLADTVRHFENSTTILAVEIGDTPKGSGELNILGFGILRPKYVGYTIGPLYASSPVVGAAILKRLISAVPLKTFQRPGTEPFDLTVIELEDSKNSVIRTLVQSLGLEREYLMYRMYSKEDIPLPLDKVYAIACTESFLL